MNAKTPREALDYCIRERGILLNLNTNESLTQIDINILIRLGYMLRFYNADNSQSLVKTYISINKESKQVLISQFDIISGFNSWKRNPIYVPAILINLFNTKNIGDPILNVLNCTVCIAKLFQYFDTSYRESEATLCFNDLAKLVTSKPKLFLNADQFKPNQFKIDDKNDVILG